MVWRNAAVEPTNTNIANNKLAAWSYDDTRNSAGCVSGVVGLGKAGGAIGAKVLLLVVSYRSDDNADSR